MVRRPKFSITEHLHVKAGLIEIRTKGCQVKWGCRKESKRKAGNQQKIVTKNGDAEQRNKRERERERCGTQVELLLLVKK